MASIVENVVGDRALELGNEEFIRPLAFGNQWQRLRIALRLVTTWTGSGVTGAQFVVGVCAGTTDGYKSANTADFVGMHWGGVFNGNLTAVAGPPNHYLSFNNGFLFIRRIGSTNTTASAAAGPPRVSAGTYRGHWVFDVLKGSPNYTVKGFAITGVPALDIGTRWQHWFDTKDESAVLNAGEPGGSSYTSLAYSGAGFFDCLSISWNQSSPLIQISDITVTRTL